MSELYKCNPCQKFFTGPVPYTQHLASVKHKRKVENPVILLARHSGEGTDDTPAPAGDPSPLSRQYTCQECELICSGPIPYLQHLQGIAHLKRRRRNVMLQQFIHSSGLSPKKEEDVDAEKSTLHDGEATSLGNDVSNGKADGVDMAAVAPAKPTAPELDEMLSDTPKQNETNGTSEAGDVNLGLPKARDSVSMGGHSPGSLDSTLQAVNTNANTLGTMWMPLNMDNGTPHCTASACQACAVVFTSPLNARDHYVGKKHQKALRRNQAVLLFQQGLDAGKILAVQHTDACKDTKPSLPYTCDDSSPQDTLMKEINELLVDPEPFALPNGAEAEDSCAGNGEVKIKLPEEPAGEPKADLVKVSGEAGSDAAVTKTEPRSPSHDVKPKSSILEAGCRECEVNFFEDGMETCQHVKDPSPPELHTHSESDSKSEGDTSEASSAESS